MSKSIAVIGAGPGLGQAMARRYAAEGYAIALVARRRAPLEQLAEELTTEGAQAHTVAADLVDTQAIPALAERIRAVVGDPDVLYYGAAANGFVPVNDLTSDRVRKLLPVGLDALLSLVQAFLPAMLARRAGAILSAQGASALHGNPYIAGGVVLAAQRNYLQALHTQVAGQGVYVGGLYVGAAIEHTPFHADMMAAKAAGTPGPDLPVVSPALLADLLWSMHTAAGPAEATYP